MVRLANSREREEELLDLLVESYIQESRPISSTYLCDKYHLPCSSATVRNILENLERKGYLSHVHTSSGRVPTKGGFKHYVSGLQEADTMNNYPVDLSAYTVSQADIDDAMGHTLDILAQISGYTSLVAFSGKNEKCFFRGTRFIFEQPEFESVERLKSLFYILEVKMGELQQMLFHYFDENIKFLIGDEIGFEEISDCSLIVSGAREKELSFALAILGPMRMDYIRAASCVCAMKNQLKKTIEEFLL